MVDTVEMTSYGYTSFGAMQSEDGPWAAYEVNNGHAILSIRRLMTGGARTRLSDFLDRNNDWKESTAMKAKQLMQFLLVPMLLLCLETSAHAFYDASVGRWVNRDPLGEPGHETLINTQSRAHYGFAELLPEGPSLYGFVQNNPVVFYDADGRVIPLIIGGGVALTTAQAVAASFGVGLIACLASPPCAQAIRTALANLISRCTPKYKEPPYPKLCDTYRDACIAFGGQDCFSCWRECQSTGTWPDYKCDSKNYVLE